MKALRLWLSIVFVSALVPIPLKVFGVLTMSWFWLAFGLFTFIVCWFTALLLVVLYLVNTLDPE